jgi:hypothetical protein
MHPTLLAGLAFSLLTPFATAQLHSGMPQPLPGTPMTPPPVDHPALGAQPGFGGDAPRPSGGGGGGGGQKGAPQPRPAPPEDTVGAKLGGRDLKKVVAKVTALKWGKSLEEAFVQSAATGKPVLWLQALGDIDGFA